MGLAYERVCKKGVTYEQYKLRYQRYAQYYFGEPALAKEEL